MSDTIAGLRRQIDSATDLQSVVRTMKALAASSIGQYERSVGALADYYRTVELGLGACFRDGAPRPLRVSRRGGSASHTVSAVVFGSDQGLVGRFNEAVTEAAIATLATLPEKPRIWAVGERVAVLLAEAGRAPVGHFPVPAAVSAIASLVGQILVAGHSNGVGSDHADDAELHLFYNSPSTGATYQSVHHRLLPLDETWRLERAQVVWPGRNLPEIVGDRASTLQALIREYLFVSLFRACAESLASENASRLAAMQRAERNIADVLEGMRATYHQQRQDSIDAELFDVVAGFNALLSDRTA